MGTGFYKLPDKKQLDILYGVFRKQPRGSGMLCQAAERTPYGYNGLILQALRLRLRYPLGCPDIDRYITRLMIERRPCRFDYLGFDTDSFYYVLHARGGGSWLKFPVYRGPVDQV
jgi:hypothetical protein